MNPTHHPSCNDVLRAPPGVPASECSDLHIMRAKTPDGRDCVVSFWELDDTERQCAARGEPVRFLCWGQTHPPVSLWVEPSPEELDAAGQPKIKMTVLEAVALSALNGLKAWLDSDRTTPPPAETVRQMEAAISLATMRRKGVA